MELKDLQSVLATIVVPDAVHAGHSSPPRIQFFVAGSLAKQAMALAGARSTLGDNTVPRLAVVAGKELIDFITYNGMVYGADPATLAQHYFLDLNENGSLRLCYQVILGGRSVAMLNRSALDAVLGQMAAAYAGSLGTTMSASPGAPAPAQVEAAPASGRRRTSP